MKVRKHVAIVRNGNVGGRGVFGRGAVGQKVDGDQVTEATGADNGRCVEGSDKSSGGRATFAGDEKESAGRL